MPPKKSKDQIKKKKDARSENENLDYDKPAELETYIEIEHEVAPCPPPLEFKLIDAKGSLCDKLIELSNMRYDREKMIRSCKTVSSAIASGYSKPSTKKLRKKQNKQKTTKAEEEEARERVFKCSFVIVEEGQYNPRFADTASDDFRNKANFYKKGLDNLYKRGFKNKEILMKKMSPNERKRMGRCDFVESEIVSLKEGVQDKSLAVHFNLYFSEKTINVERFQSTFSLKEDIYDILAPYFEEGISDLNLESEGIKHSKLKNSKDSLKKLKIQEDSVQIHEEAGDKQYLLLNLPNLQFSLEKHLRCLMVTKSVLEQYRFARSKAKQKKSKQKIKIPQKSGYPIPGFMRTTDSDDERHERSLIFQEGHKILKNFGCLIPDLSTDDIDEENEERRALDMESEWWSNDLLEFLKFQEECMVKFPDTAKNDFEKLLEETKVIYNCLQNSRPQNSEELKDFFDRPDVIQAFELEIPNEAAVSLKEEMIDSNKILVNSNKTLTVPNNEHVYSNEELTFSNKIFKCNDHNEKKADEKIEHLNTNEEEAKNIEVIVISDDSDSNESSKDGDECSKDSIENESRSSDEIMETDEEEDCDKCELCSDLEKSVQVDSFLRQGSIISNIMKHLDELAVTNNILLMKKRKLASLINKKNKEVNYLRTRDKGVIQLWKSFEQHLSSDSMQKREGLETIQNVMKTDLEKYCKEWLGKP